jgi:hypothetical protein
MPTAERRGATRIDKVFRVLLSTDELGDQWFVARNISATGMFVEMASPIPLRTKVIVRFALPDLEDSPCPGGEEPCIGVMARVQNHYYLQFSDNDGLRALSGVGLRFLRFLPQAGASVPVSALH